MRTQATAAIRKAAGTERRQEHARAENELQWQIWRAETREAKAANRRAAEQQARAEAHKGQNRAAINRKYEAQLAALAKTPHFTVFWGTAALAVAVIFYMLRPREPVAEMAFGLMLGPVPGFILQIWMRESKTRSPHYLAVLAQRDAEPIGLTQETVRPLTLIRGIVSPQ
ncbi:hypothetical protein CS8_101140 [Cupriavidus sp. 8B]